MIQRRLRGAFLGYGNVAASGHMPGWQALPGVELAAAADASASRRALFEASGGARSGGVGRRAYASTAALLAAEPLDFVDICTPPGTHAEQIEQALDAGLHVLCEKPLTISAPSAVRIAETARAAGRVVHVVHNWLAAPVCRMISDLLASGAIGEVRSISWTTSRNGVAVAVAGQDGANWRMDPEMAGGGILFDHGWHAAYCVARWAGAPPRRVSARLENRRFTDWPVEDTATLDIAFGPVLGRIHLTWAAEERSNVIAIVGDRGRIESAGAEILLKDSRGTHRLGGLAPLAEGSHHSEWFAQVAQDFVNAVTGAAPSNLGEALLCSTLIDAATRSSAADGSWVLIPPPAAESGAAQALRKEA